MLYYVSTITLCYALVLLIVYIRHTHALKDLFKADSVEDILFPNACLFLASPIFLVWIVYDEFIKKDY